MESSYRGLGSLMSRGSPGFLANTWGVAAAEPSPLWPLDYSTLAYAAETSFYPRFPSAHEPTSPFGSVPPYGLMFPNMIYPVPQDFDDVYMLSQNNRLCQELCSSPMLVSRTDSQISPCPVFTTGLLDSPRTEHVSDKSLESSGRILDPGNQARDISQASVSMCSDFMLHNSKDGNTVKNESNKMAATTTSPRENLAVTSSETSAVAVAAKFSTKQIELPTTVDSADPDTSSNQESRADSVLTTANNRKNQTNLKRRKTQQKTVVCVPATGGADKPTGECVPADSWSWRKYGQKPIKGSPYPRGYYRCSSSKGCTARKQVERSRSDASMLIITYTSDHNHVWSTPRNSHAGTSRRNSVEKRDHDSSTIPSDLSSDLISQAMASIIDSPALQEDHAVSPTTTTMERTLSIDPESDFDIANSDAARDDDFYAQLEELPDCFVMFKRSPVRERSDDEADVSQVVDPFNLFTWSSNGSERKVDSIW